MPGRRLDNATFTVVAAVTLVVGAPVMLAAFLRRMLRSTTPADRQARGAQHVDRIRQVLPHVSFPRQVVPIA